MSRLTTNGDTKTTEQMMHEALDKLIRQTQSANVGELRDVRMAVRTNGVAGRHVHASASVKVHFSSCVTERPIPAEVLDDRL